VRCTGGARAESLRYATSPIRSGAKRCQIASPRVILAWAARRADPERAYACAVPRSGESIKPCSACLRP
jgi:hypothetical protein